jgi:pentatricopeptide repeat protein
VELLHDRSALRGGAVVGGFQESACLNSRVQCRCNGWERKRPWEEVSAGIPEMRRPRRGKDGVRWNASSAADVRVWTSLMSAYSKAGDFQEAVSLFRQMQCCGVTTDAHAISCVLKCVASLGSLTEGEVIHGLLEKLGLGQACAVTNALIVVYSWCGRMEDAAWVFDSMHPRDAISWNSMIGGCFSNGWHGTVVDLFSKMWSQGTEISSVTVLSVLPACAVEIIVIAT